MQISGTNNVEVAAGLKIQANDTDQKSQTATEIDSGVEKVDVVASVNTDKVSLSADAKQLAASSAEKSENNLKDAKGKAEKSEDSDNPAKVQKEQAEKAEERQNTEKVQHLSERDREVRVHEQTHAAIAGAYASAPSYTYEKGPDGRMYAVEGEVSIDTSPESTPEATIKKAEIIQRAALSVAEPSAADRSVAARARVMAVNAQAEILQQEQQNPEAVDKADKTEVASTTNQADAKETESEKSSEPKIATENRTAEVNQRLVETGMLRKIEPGTLLSNQT